MRRAGERLGGRLERPPAREQVSLDACGREPLLLLGAAGGAGDLPAFGLQPPRERERGVAEPEHEQPAHGAAPHSAATSGSLSAGPWRAARRAKAGASSS